MSNLAHRQQKIQEKRRQTPWREFVMEICSWSSFILYKNQSLISKYPPNLGRVIITKGKEGSEDIMIDIIQSGSFFRDFRSLLQQVPLEHITHLGLNENCDYANHILSCKNVYLSNFVTFGSENIFYSLSVKFNCTNVYYSFDLTDFCENIFISKHITQSSNIFFSDNISNSNNIWCSMNLIGCSECLFCSNLENQLYYIENISYSKQEYLIKKQELLQAKDSFVMPDNPGVHNINTSGSLGNQLINCSNLQHGYANINTQDGNNVILCSSPETSSDIYDSILLGRVNHAYGLVGGGGFSEHVYMCHVVVGSSNMYYCLNCESCSFCLGCIGLKNKSYCILNKQYSKEERYEKVDAIFSQMDTEGTLGAFFPATMNPFYFNDTAAYLIDPSFTKEEVTARGYLRRDEPIKVDIPEGAKVVKVSELGIYEGWMDEIGQISPNPSLSRGEQVTRRIDPEILKVIIQDESGNVYKIVKMEYDFLMKHGLPLPRKHWLERMKENFRIN